jgi:hypothetical protein
MPELWHLGVIISILTPRFSTRLFICVEFVVDNKLFGKVYFPVIHFLCASFNSTIPRANLCMLLLCGTGQSRQKLAIIYSFHTHTDSTRLGLGMKFCFNPLHATSWTDLCGLRALRLQHLKRLAHCESSSTAFLNRWYEVWYIDVLEEWRGHFMIYTCGCLKVLR